MHAKTNSCNTYLVIAMQPILEEFVTKQITAAYVSGYKKCLEDYGKLNRYISKNIAYKMYGRDVIEMLIEKGLIKVIKNGDGRNAKCLIEREKLELVVFVNNIKTKPKKKPKQ